MEFSVDTKEVDKWINNQPNRDRARGLAMRVMKNELVDKVKEAVGGHSVSNELESSVIGEATDKEIDIYSKMYGDIVLEWGRAPGKMPPMEALRDWATRRMGDPNMAYVIARNIARGGTKKYRDKAPKELSMLMERFEKEFMEKELDKLLDEYTK